MSQTLYRIAEIDTRPNSHFSLRPVQSEIDRAYAETPAERLSSAARIIATIGSTHVGKSRILNALAKALANGHLISKVAESPTQNIERRPTSADAQLLLTPSNFLLDLEGDSGSGLPLALDVTGMSHEQQTMLGRARSNAVKLQLSRLAYAVADVLVCVSEMNFSINKWVEEAIELAESASLNISIPDNLRPALVFISNRRTFEEAERDYDEETERILNLHDPEGILRSYFSRVVCIALPVYQTPEQEQQFEKIVATRVAPLLRCIIDRRVAERPTFISEANWIDMVHRSIGTYFQGIEWKVPGNRATGTSAVVSDSAVAPNYSYSSKGEWVLRPAPVFNVYCSLTMTALRAQKNSTSRCGEFAERILTHNESEVLNLIPKSAVEQLHKMALEQAHTTGESPLNIVMQRCFSMHATVFRRVRACTMTMLACELALERGVRSTNFEAIADDDDQLQNAPATSKKKTEKQQLITALDVSSPEFSAQVKHGQRLFDQLWETLTNMQPCQHSPDELADAKGRKIFCQLSRGEHGHDHRAPSFRVDRELKRNQDTIVHKIKMVFRTKKKSTANTVSASWVGDFHESPCPIDYDRDAVLLHFMEVYSDLLTSDYTTLHDKCSKLRVSNFYEATYASLIDAFMHALDTDNAYTAHLVRQQFLDRVKNTYAPSPQSWLYSVKTPEPCVMCYRDLVAPTEELTCGHRFCSSCRLHITAFFVDDAISSNKPKTQCILCHVCQ